MAFRCKGLENRKNKGQVAREKEKNMKKVLVALLVLAVSFGFVFAQAGGETTTTTAGGEWKPTKDVEVIVDGVRVSRTGAEEDRTAPVCE